jgi:hypothetical protein
MKIEFRIPQPAVAAPRATAMEYIRGDQAYAPLSRPDLLARRIEVGPRSRVELRRHRWKRDDESVN